MDKKDAIDKAANMFILLSKHQPGMIQFNGSTGPMNLGKEAAQFCTDFIDTYAEWLLKNSR